MRNYSVTEAENLMGIGHTRFYIEVNSGRLNIIKVGRRTLVPEQSLIDWQQQMIAESTSRQAEAVAS